MYFFSYLIDLKYVCKLRNEVLFVCLFVMAVSPVPLQTRAAHAQVMAVCGAEESAPPH